MKIRVGIADDHDLIRQGIVKLLEDGGCEVVLQANNGQDLIKALKMKSPDVILMDINMPELDGIAATQWVTENKSKCKVVALTALNDDINI
ncbi:MAG: response regulator, partial [Flavobacteriales bacterium]